MTARIAGSRKLRNRHMAGVTLPDLAPMLAEQMVVTAMQSWGVFRNDLHVIIRVEEHGLGSP